MGPVYCCYWELGAPGCPQPPGCPPWTPGVPSQCLPVAPGPPQTGTSIFLQLDPTTGLGAPLKFLPTPMATPHLGGPASPPTGTPLRVLPPSCPPTSEPPRCPPSPYPVQDALPVAVPHPPQRHGQQCPHAGWGQGGRGRPQQPPQVAHQEVKGQDDGGALGEGGSQVHHLGGGSQSPPVPPQQPPSATQEPPGSPQQPPSATQQLPNNPGHSPGPSQ